MNGIIVDATVRDGGMGGIAVPTTHPGEVIGNASTVVDSMVEVPPTIINLIESRPRRKEE